MIGVQLEVFSVSDSPKTTMYIFISMLKSYGSGYHQTQDLHEIMLQGEKIFLD